MTLPRGGRKGGFMYKKENQVIEDVNQENQENQENQVIDNEKIEENQVIDNEKIEETSKTGKVNCVALNVREQPNTETLSLAIVHKDMKLRIDIDSSTDEWFAVCTATGIEGYCVKKYVDVEQ